MCLEFDKKFHSYTAEDEYKNLEPMVSSTAVFSHPHSSVWSETLGSDRCRIQS